MNDTNNALSIISSLRQGLANVQQSMPSRSFEPYLRMDKGGHWIYGQEGTEVERGSQWAIHPGSIQQGYVCWTRYPEEDKRSNEKLGEVMVPASQPLPVVTSLPQHPFPWTEQVAFHVACVNGEDKGLQTQYTCTSYGGMQEVKERLFKAMIGQIDREAGKGADARIVPIIELESDSYIHKKYGRTYTPSFKIVGWSTLSADKAPQAQPQPQPAQAAQAAPPLWDEPQETATADAPRRRRSRS